jgi:hypothetical protein
MAIIQVLLPFILNAFLPLAHGVGHSSRLVVTFRTASDNKLSVLDNFNFLNGTRVVKQYGRRLVLDLGAPFDLEAERGNFAVFESVQSVETDFLIGLEQTDPPLLVSDALLVTNATDPDVDGAFISPSTQTPLWNLMDSEPYSIHVEGVWHVTNSTPDVVVAIVDSGMAKLAKPMFINLLDGYDFISDDGISIDRDGRDPDATDPGDWGDMCPIPSWHGTKVASILAARHDNEFGMKGVAQNCSVLPVRVLGLCRMGYATDVTDAIVWSAGGTINGVPDNANPAKIISLSLAGQGACPDYLQSAVSQAVALGSIIIAAAGNSNQNVSGFFPANCEGVISVGASTREGKLAGYSNWGTSVSAPGGDTTNAIMTLGVNMVETDLEIFFGTGTSFAAPHMSGILALINHDKNRSLGIVFDKYTEGVTNTSHRFNATCNAQRCAGRLADTKSIMVSAVNCANLNTKFRCGSSWEDEHYCEICSCPVGYKAIIETVHSHYQTDEWGSYEHFIYYAGCLGCDNGNYCPGGQAQQIAWTVTSCNAGQYLSRNPSSTVDGACSPCSPGSASAAGATVCTPCTVNTFGISSSTSCTPCASGTYSNPGSSVCKAAITCSAGYTYNPSYDVISSSYTATCPLGSYVCGFNYQNIYGYFFYCCNIGGAQVGHWRISNNNFNAGNGAGVIYTSTSSGYPPSPFFAPNTYNTFQYGISRISWTSGSAEIYSNGGLLHNIGSRYGDFYDSTCTAGKVATGFYGWWGSRIDQVSAVCNTLCVVCPTCTVGNYWSVACTGTAAGICSPCLPGKYCLGGTSTPVSWTVTTCTAGNYLSTINSASADGFCSPCTAGTFSAGSATICTDCTTGKYSAIQSALSCTQCGAGTYASAQYATVCKACAAGTTSVIGASVCASCAGIPSTAQFTLLCSWKCNVGYFKTSPTCTQCTQNTSCSAGLYAPICTVDTSNTACNVPCDSKSQQLDSQYTIYSINQPISETSCWWGCNQGYYKNEVTKMCVTCEKTCLTGHYPSSTCYNSFTFLGSNAPECRTCDSIPQATLTGPGLPNDPRSCPFGCNDKFYLSSPRNCTAWRDSCSKGFELQSGTPIKDATCTKCSPYYGEDVYAFYVQDTCIYDCVDGREKSTVLAQSGICTQCPIGKYRNFTAAVSPSCRECNNNEYQPSLGQEDCNPVPPNGYSINLKTDYACNAGYYRQTPDPSDASLTYSCPTCANNRSALPTNQMKDVVWNTLAFCTITSFTCNAGHYRNWTLENCIQCPGIPANSLRSNAAPCTDACVLRSRSASTVEADRNDYCPFECNYGYYSSPDLNYNCLRCTAVTCSSGLFHQLCSQGQTADQCLTCSYRITNSQSWTNLISCQWHCKAGYFLDSSILNAVSCQMCTPDKYKTLAGNHSCSVCPAGSYSSSTVSCDACSAGSYTDVSSSTECKLCPMGSYAPSENSIACKSCLTLQTYPDSTSSIDGATMCTACPNAAPFSEDGVTCELPLPPCPKGFYMNTLAKCSVCPIGTYCNTTSTVYPLTCPFERPVSIPPAISEGDCSDSSASWISEELRNGCI